MRWLAPILALAVASFPAATRACSFFTADVVMDFHHLPALQPPRTGILLKRVDVTATEASAAGTWLRVETSNVFEPVATIRRLRDKDETGSARFTDITIASAKCPAIVTALREIRTLEFSAQLELPGDVGWGVAGVDEVPCPATSYALSVVSSPDIQAQFDQNDRAHAEWADKTIDALLACPGFEPEASR